MKFDLKNNKEYIYSKNLLQKNEPFINDIGKTFIDFLAYSDDIIKVIEDEIYPFHKHIKLGDTTNLHAVSKFKLEKLHLLFRYFDFDFYLENLRKKNNEKTLEEVFDEYIRTIKFWINFSKYILINFYNLSSEKYDNNFPSTQRLLDYLLHINRTYFNESILILPNSNITFE